MCFNVQSYLVYDHHTTTTTNGTTHTNGTNGIGNLNGVKAINVKSTSVTNPEDEEQQLKSDSDDTFDMSKYQLSLLTENTNSIGVYGRPIKRLKLKLEQGNPDNNVFDEVAHEVYNDLRLDVYPRFCRSHLYQMYLR